VTKRPRKAGERSGLVEIAYAALRGRILDNDMKPGFQALEAELALGLGMSRTPVHEALLRLQADGLVEIQPRRGVRVLPISPEDMREIYEILTCVEAAAAELLASRRPSVAELVGLERAVADMERALARNDLKAWADADERFHRAILELCGNRRLARIGLTFQGQVRRARMVTLRLRAKPYKSNAAHKALVQCIKRGDAAAAGKNHRHQRQRGSDELMAILKRYELPYL
jgi:DNA-binding GntR family transcriptional regulator